MVISIGSSIISYFILISLSVLGFRRGFRYMLSIALFVSIAYLLTVHGGNSVIGLINRFYSNVPKLFALLLGRDPSTVNAFSPLIPSDLLVPLLLRIIVFIALLSIGIGYAWPWEGIPTRGSSKIEQIFGLISGIYTGVLGIAAIGVFWSNAPEALNNGGLISTALNGLPDFTILIPPLIFIFFVILIIIMFFRFRLIWKSRSGQRK